MGGLSFWCARSPLIPLLSSSYNFTAFVSSLTVLSMESHAFFDIFTPIKEEFLEKNKTIALSYLIPTCTAFQEYLSTLGFQGTSLQLISFFPVGHWDAFIIFPHPWCFLNSSIATSSCLVNLNASSMTMIMKFTSLALISAQNLILLCSKSLVWFSKASQSQYFHGWYFVYFSPPPIWSSPNGNLFIRLLKT